jgi:putative cell wall-binding protein
VVAAAVLALTVPGQPAPTSAADPAPTAATGFAPAPSGQAPCPEGRSRSSTVYVQGFESGIPESRYNAGFARFSDATSGRYSARSVLSGQRGTSEHFFLPYRQVPTGASTYLGFTARGGSTPAAARAVVNSVLTNFSTRTSWRGVRVDITAATRDEGGWLGTWFEHRARAGSSTALLVDDVEIYRCRTNATTRVAESDRFATAAALSRDTAPGVRTLYVASGLDYPDALSAAAVAGSSGTRILLVRPDSIPTTTAQALDRLNPQRIVVLGGSRAVNSTVQRQLGAYASTVDRIGGANRYETSALVSRHFSPGVLTAYVATGQGFADALSGGALAADRNSPLLLVTKSGIPNPVRAELTRLRPDSIIVLGGPAAVADNVVEGLRRYATSRAQVVRRISGSDRYAVSAAVAAQFSSPRTTYLATGTGFADAITGGAVAGDKGVPLLLSRPADLPGSVRSRLQSLRESNGVVLGGTSALESIVRDQYGQTLP